MAGIALLPLLLILVRFTGSVTALETNSIRCQAVVESWATRELVTLATARASRRADPFQLQELLFFLHIPRTGGRTYHQCFLKNLYSVNERCARSYDELRIDTSAPNCRLLSSHDDYSLITKLPRNLTSVVTNLRDPLDRVLSTYEFSVEVASRYLRPQPSALSLQTRKRMSTRRRLPAGKQVVNTLDIWPWKYLVPLLQKDGLMRRDLRKNGAVLLESEVVNTYDVPSMAMPLHEFIHHPIAMDLVHNGATFQVAGLTNNSAVEEAGFIRECVNSYDNLSKLVLDVAKGRLDEMLYVGLTEKHQESAVMFATVVGSQVKRTQPAMIPTGRQDSKIIGSSVGIKAFKDQKLNNSRSLRAETYFKTPGQTTQQVGSDDDMRHLAVEEQKVFIGALLKSYQGCVSNLQSTQLSRRMTTLEFIKPVNFSKEHRRRIPDVTIQEIYHLNALDVELFKHAEKIFEKQELVVNQPDFLEKRMLHLELEHRRLAQTRDSSDMELGGPRDGSPSEALQNFLTWGTLLTLLCVSVTLVGLAMVLKSFHRQRSRDRSSPRVHRSRDVTTRSLKYTSYYTNGSANMKEKVDAPRLRQ